MSKTTLSQYKSKIFNDPVYGFISIDHELVQKVIDHPYFQRLRRIQQLGLTHLVYPGAVGTRFHHVLGAMHLMSKAINVLRRKGVDISEQESLGALLAILLHDIGHGPFSHALEYSIVNGVTHEDLSLLFMEKLNEEFEGDLSLAIQIFKGDYPKKFLHELVSSQLDMDRMDYLNRDSFYSGVSEGVIGFDRIIEMLIVHDGHLAIEEKGIYSVEKFLVARRLMYWQVYLHKTVIAAEFMLVKVLKRAKELAQKGVKVFASPKLTYFLERSVNLDDFKKDEICLKYFAGLDDLDIMSAIKVWQEHDDPILSELSSRIVNRKLFKVKILNQALTAEQELVWKKKIALKRGVDVNDTSYLWLYETITNKGYKITSEAINVKYKNGNLLNMSEAADNLNISAMADPVTKYFFCYPEDMSIEASNFIKKL